MWVDNFNDAKTFYRVKAQALVPGTAERYNYDIVFLSSETDIKSPDTRVLYKHPETQEVSFVQMKDIRTSFEDALILFTDADSLTSQMILGSQEIAYDRTETTHEESHPDCERRCRDNSSCMGYKTHTNWYSVRELDRWYMWTRSLRYPVYTTRSWSASRCEFFLKDSDDPQLKTSAVDGYRRYFYSGAGQ